MSLFDFPPATHDNCDKCAAELTGEAERASGVCEACFQSGDGLIRDFAREWLKCDAALTNLELANATLSMRLGALRSANERLQARCRRLEDALETRLLGLILVGLIGFAAGFGAALWMVGGVVGR